LAVELGVVMACAVGIGDGAIIGVEVSSGCGGGTRLKVSPCVGSGEGVSNGAGLAASIGRTLAVGNGLTVAVGEGLGFAVAVGVATGFGFAVGVGTGVSSGAAGVLARNGVEAASCAWAHAAAARNAITKTSERILGISGKFLPRR
jgi:hypothetical protein